MDVGQVTGSFQREPGERRGHVNGAGWGNVAGRVPRHVERTVATPPPPNSALPRQRGTSLSAETRP